MPESENNENRRPGFLGLSRAWEKAGLSPIQQSEIWETGNTMKIMGYSITMDRAKVDLDVIHGFLAGTYWSEGIRRDVVEEAFKNSLFAAAIDDATGKPVGVVRVVTDYATFAWVCDVFVAPEHRGHGLSKRMLAELEQHPRLQTLRRWCLATRDAHELYEQFGYQPVVPGRWMEKRMPEERWKERG